MRTIPQAMIDALTNVRTVGGYLKVWDNRLSFDAHDGPLHDIDIIDNLFAYDACEHSSGILRVASVNVSGTKKLFYQYVSSMSSTPWPAWTDSGIALAGSSKPGVAAGRCFYHKSDGDGYYVDFNSSGVPQTPVKLWDGSATDPIAFAPINTTEYYLHWQFNLPGNSFNYGYVEYMTTGGTHYYWPGMIYGTDQYVRYFDAVRLGDTDYIYITDQEEKRTWEIRAVGNNWGTMQQVLPLDIVGDLSLFTLGGANVINSMIFVSGVLKRENGVSMQAYMIGPDHYTFGRDLYIGQNGTDIRSVTYDSQTKNFPMIGGKLFLINNKVWYIGAGVGYNAEGTRLVGVTSQYNYTINAVNNIRTDGQEDSTTSIACEIPTSVSSVYLRPGSELEFYGTIGGTSAVLGTFGIDMINKQMVGNGQIKAITGRALATKNLDMWQSDSNFDYWSQTKVNTNPATFTQLATVTGIWSKNITNNTAQLDKLNVEGVMYSVAKKSRASQVRAKFFNPTGDFKGYYGVALNYHYLPQRATVQAPNPPPPNYADNTHLGIFVLWGPTFYSGGAGIKVEVRQQSTTTVIASWSLSTPTNTYHWIQADFCDGRILVRYRLDSSTTWTDVGEAEYTIDEGNPWGDSEEGHGAIVINNVTDKAETPGVESDDTVIPVTDNSVFTTPDTMIIDDEQITVSGKTANYTGLPTLGGFQGVTYPNATHNNANWINGVLWNYQFDGNSGQNICDTTSNKHVCRSITASGNIAIRKVKFRVKKVGSPAQNLYVYLTTDGFDDATPPAPGAILATCSVAPGSIGTSYSYVEWTFATPQSITADNYFFALTNVASGAPVIDASNYYVVAIDNTEIDEYGVIRVYGSTTWRTLDVAIPFYVIGDGIDGDGYEIYIATPDTSKARDYYDDLALVVTGGPGKGSVFRITDYDYQAPCYWKPNRSYEPPDKWEDHIGDTDHGSWINQNARRIFVSEDPTGIIGYDSLYKIYPSLIVTARGANGTVATTHSPTGTELLYVMEYRALSVQCAQYIETSYDVDIPFAWMAAEIARKAGVLTVTTEKYETGSLVLTHGGWDVNNDVPNTERIQRNFIARFKIASGTEAGIAFHMSKSGGVYSNGRIVTITSTNVSLYDRDGQSLLERFPFPDHLGDWITISVQDLIYSVWVGNRLVASFADIDSIAGDYAGFVSNGNATLTVDWEELDMRVDNYILDMGRSGAQLLSGLIGEKHIHFQDTQYGGLHLFRDRVTVNSTPFSLISQSGVQDLETEMVTRIRVEGVEVAEVYDVANMRANGNVFRTVNLNEVNNLADAQREANYILSEASKQSAGDTFVGAADPRIEIGDIVKITDPEGTRDIVVRQLGYMLAVGEEDAIFDMSIGGYDA